MRSINKALTFRASSIGDCLMARYLLENIHMQYPHAKLGIVVSSRAGMIRDLMADVPWLQVVEANRHSVWSLWRLWREWHNCDLVVTQYAGKHGGAFGFASKCAARLLARRGGLVGFNDSSPWNTFLYNKLLPVRREQAVAEHEREALRAAGLSVPVSYPFISVHGSHPRIDMFGFADSAYVLVHPFAGNAGRSLSPDKTRELILELKRVLPSCHFAISGGPGDITTAKRIADGLDDVSVLAGAASLQEMLKLIDASVGVVSVDTGVAHLSAQLRKPLVVLRTCLGPNWWFPEQYGPKAPIRQFSKEALCKPHVQKDYPDCINQISMAEVSSACTQLFYPYTVMR